MWARHCGQERRQHAALEDDVALKIDAELEPLQQQVAPRPLRTALSMEY